MPCDSLAVIQGRISPDMAAAILESDRALDALRRFIESLVKERPVEIKRYSTTAASIIVGALCSVSITKNGIRVSAISYSTSTSRLEKLTDDITGRAERLSIALSIEKAEAKLRERYTVTSAQTLSTGARVIRLAV